MLVDPSRLLGVNHLLWIAGLMAINAYGRVQAILGGRLSASNAHVRAHADKPLDQRELDLLAFKYQSLSNGPGGWHISACSNAGNDRPGW